MSAPANTNQTNNKRARSPATTEDDGSNPTKIPRHGSSFSDTSGPQPIQQPSMGELPEQEDEWVQALFFNADDDPVTSSSASSASSASSSSSNHGMINGLESVGQMASILDNPLSMSNSQGQYPNQQEYQLQAQQFDTQARYQTEHIEHQHLYQQQQQQQQQQYYNQMSAQMHQTMTGAVNYNAGYNNYNSGGFNGATLGSGIMGHNNMNDSMDMSMGMSMDMSLYPMKSRKKKKPLKRRARLTLPLFPMDYGDDGPQEYMEIESVEFCYQLLRVHGMRKPILIHGTIQNKKGLILLFFFFFLILLGGDICLCSHGLFLFLFLLFSFYLCLFHVPQVHKNWTW